MLYELIQKHREEIIARMRAKVSKRTAPKASELELESGPPLFIDQLIEALRHPTGERATIESTAVSRGAAMLRMGFTVGQVVHDYGNLCQAVTEVAHEIHAEITPDEFHTFNRCLDEAIADAVGEYTRCREQSLTAEGAERLGVLAHELRNRLSAAMLAFEMLKQGTVGINGNTGAILDRNLKALRDLVDGSLASVRLQAALVKRARVSVFELIEEIEVNAAIEANSREIALSVDTVERDVYVEADRSSLVSAIANLVQNALKFTRPHGHVLLSVRTTDKRVYLDVQDECGGLPPGAVEDMFHPFTQRGADRSGVGLGLTISLKGVEANDGTIRVKDLPGTGCVFTVDLPRLPAI